MDLQPPCVTFPDFVLFPVTRWFRPPHNAPRLPKRLSSAAGTMTFKEWLRDSLQRQGMSIRELADRCEVDHTTVMAWLRGRQPAWERTAKIAEAMAADVIHISSEEYRARHHLIASRALSRPHVPLSHVPTAATSMRHLPARAFPIQTIHYRARDRASRDGEGANLNLSRWTCRTPASYTHAVLGGPRQIREDLFGTPQTPTYRASIGPAE